MTALVYGVLVVFVFIYTNVIIGALKKAATPDNLSAVIKSTIQEQLPALREKVISSAKDNAPQLAEYLVTLPKEVVPMLEDRIKELADNQIDVVVVGIKTDLVPRIVDILDANAEAINLTAESLKDQSVANALALLLVEELEVEMDKLFNDQFRRSCADLRNQIDQIREKPTATLSQQERVERQLLVNWVFLTEYGDAQTAYGNVVERLGHAYEFLFNTLKAKVELGGDEDEGAEEAEEEDCAAEPVLHI
jgi:hypothetical protein